MEKFVLETSVGKFENCHFVGTRYADTKNLCLMVYDDEEPVADCTINTKENIGDDCLNVDMQHNMFDFLVKENIIDANDNRSENIYGLTAKGKMLF
jgi:hypothetical protein